ncbi:MAG: DevC protein [Alphaproteobacteria bacterium]|nr:DevC protein [Alphaproteobacteria bacterium]MCK5659288.1 DevC protein [Alphaproteobacteria bacterium]
MSPVKAFFLASRLAWRQLTHEKANLFAAMLGVLFACVLVFMQLGFKDSLYASIIKLPVAMEGDLFLMHKQTEAIWRTVSFSRQQLKRAFALPEVEKVVPVYIWMAQWKNPDNKTKRTLQLLGYDPDTKLLKGKDIRENKKRLLMQDTLIFDNLSRPEFGPVEKMLSEQRLFTEINDHKVEVVGTFKIGPSFAADGNAITSALNFLRIFPERLPERIDLGVIYLKPGSNILAVQAFLQRRLDEDLNVMTHDEMIVAEMAYWQDNAPVGFIFGFGVVIGLVVGMVIVYQILFTDITNHLNEYATLKALGYPHYYLTFVVFTASLILAIIGFVPGLILSAALYRLSEGVLYIPMPLGLGKILTIFCLILGMCIISGSIAMKKLKSANPADMF